MDDAAAEEEDSRLGGLQDDLILKILSFLDLRDAIKTSVLSPRWRYVRTSLPHLTFSTEDFSTMDNFLDFVTRVLSRRINTLSSLTLYLRSKDGGGGGGLDVAQRIIDYASSLNVQQLNLTCVLGNSTYLSYNNIRFSLSLSSSAGLLITLASTPLLSSLTTLHLEDIPLYDDIFSMCPNLENLTLTHCTLLGSQQVLRICHPRLSNLTLHMPCCTTPTTNLVTPKLKSLTATDLSGSYLISAPDLASFFFRGTCPLSFSTDGDGFPCLEKAQLSLRFLRRSHAPNIISLLRKLRNVKLLSLSQEIIKLLNASLSHHQLSPFTHLQSLTILPKVACLGFHKHTKIIMSTQVKNYLLNASSKATLTEVLEHCCDMLEHCRETEATGGRWLF